MDNKVTLEITRNTISVQVMVNNAMYSQTYTRRLDPEYDRETFYQDMQDTPEFATILRNSGPGSQLLGRAIDRMEYTVWQDIADALEKTPVPPEVQPAGEVAWAAREAERNVTPPATPQRKRALTAQEKQQQKYDELAERIRQRREAGAYGPEVKPLAPRVAHFESLTRKKAVVSDSKWERITRRKG